MASPSFPVAAIHQVAILSCFSWFAVTVLAHLLSSRLWRNYSKLKYKHKLAWCNRIASAVHATVLVAGQVSNINDPILNADPLFGVTDQHFFWGSIMYGYLKYDTLFTLVFYEAVGTVAFLLHHCLGLICCCFGLYFNKMALFGTAIQVFFEGTTPLLHVMGCLKLMGRESTSSYTALGMTFVAQFFVCRVVIANYYWLRMISAVSALDSKPAWALGGVMVYGVLSGLNLFWFYKLMLMALAAGSNKPHSKGTSAVQPSPTAAAATDITAAAGEAASAAVATASAAQPCRAQSSGLTNPGLVTSGLITSGVVTGLVRRGKQRAAAIAGMIPHAAAGLQTRLSECLDLTNSPTASMTGHPAKGASLVSTTLVGSPLQRSSLDGVDTALLQHSGVRRPLTSPFAALANQHALARRGIAFCYFGSAVLAQWEKRQGSRMSHRTAQLYNDQSAAEHVTGSRQIFSSSSSITKADDGEEARSCSPSRRRGRCPGNDIWG